MRSIKTLGVIGVCLVLVLAVGSAELMAASQSKFPTKPIIFVAPGTVGGGDPRNHRPGKSALQAGARRYTICRVGVGDCRIG